MADQQTASNEPEYTVSVEKLSKQFLLRDVRVETFREEMGLLAARLMGKRKKTARQELWALKDVSFQLKKGEVLGVVGPNGAGKSTLLRILAGITPPTSGRVVINGRHAAILEIGTGFHPELTGRENIWLSGSLLGYGKSEIEANFDSIVDFSGVGEFLDMPVKQYSNGMYLRLAFAIAFHADIDVLFLDEVLAVGDAEFQMRSFKRIQELAQRGVSIIVVSHNPTSISRICTRCIQLERGEIKFSGSPADVLTKYIRKAAENVDVSQNVLNRDEVAEANFDIDPALVIEGELEVSRIWMEQNGEIPKNYIIDEFPIDIFLEVNNLKPGESIEVVLQISEWGDQPLVVDSYGLRKAYSPTALARGKHIIKAQIPAFLLGLGYYFNSFTFARNSADFLMRLDAVMGFEVRQQGAVKVNAWNSQIHAPIRLHLDWEIRPVNTGEMPGVTPPQPQNEPMKPLISVRKGEKLLTEKSDWLYDFKIVTLKELFDYPSGIEDIYSRKFDGFLIRGVFSQEEVRTMLQGLADLSKSETQDISPGFTTYPPSFSQVDQHSDDSTGNLNRYFEQNVQVRADFPQQFGVDFEARLREVLGNIWPNDHIQPPEGIDNNGYYAPGNFRILRPGQSEIKTHCGNQFHNEFKSFFAHLQEKATVKDQLSYFILMQAPETGGELTLFDVEWKDAQKKSGHESLQLLNGGTVDMDGESTLSRQFINPQPGDMIIFAGGQIWHRVEFIQGTRNRITLGGFLSLSHDREKLYYWT